MKRLAMTAALVITLSAPVALAGEVPTGGVVTPQPVPQQTTNTSTSTSSDVATTVLLMLVSLIGR